MMRPVVTRGIYPRGTAGILRTGSQGMTVASRKRKPLAMRGPARLAGGGCPGAGARLVRGRAGQRPGWSATAAAPGVGVVGARGKPDRGGHDGLVRREA